jgi:hypothetical protein
MVGFLIVVAILVVFDLAAVLWGVDSRTTTGDSSSPHSSHHV